MKHLFSILFAITLMATFSACNLTETSFDPPVITVSFDTVISSFDLENTSSSGSLFFNEGFINLGGIEYQARAANEVQSVDFEFEQFSGIDFATGIARPDIRRLAITPGTYQEITFALELLTAAPQTAVLLVGMYTAPDGEVIPVRFEFDSEETFEVSTMGPFSFVERQTPVAEITFNPSVWFAGVTDDHMLNAEIDGAGYIVISETQNTNIFNMVTDDLNLATDLEIME